MRFLVIRFEAVFYVLRIAEELEAQNVLTHTPRNLWSA